jgi:3-oxoacyl-[acyl-carrier protein] reductase
MGTLKAKRALITGAGQGLGFTIAEQMIEAGANVALHYYSSEAGARELKERADERGQRAEIFRADLTSEKECVALVQRAVSFLGGLDVLINNAGDLVGRRSLSELDTAFWEKVLAINVDSLLWVTRASLPVLEKSGAASIVNLSSVAGRKGGAPGSLAYSAAKGAVLTWTRALALELAQKGIRVNAVAPGLILGTKFHATHTTPAAAEEIVRQIPLRRAGTPADVARTVVFLASEYDGFITGATVDINGGVYCA